MPELSAVVLSTDNEHRTILQIAVDHTGVGRVANSFNSYPVGTSDLILKSVLTLRPDVVIVDIVPNNPAPALHAIELLQAEIPTSAIIAIGETTKPQIIVTAMRSGAHEYVDRPATTNAMLEAFSRITAKRRKPLAGTGRGKVFTVLNAKGGSGATTLTVNTALALCSRNSNVALVDLAPMGHAALHLNVQASFTVADALRNLHRLDSALLDGYMCRCESGLQLLAGLNEPSSADLSVTDFSRFFDLMVSQYRYVFVDMSSRLDAMTKIVCDLSDTVIIVAHTDVTSLWSASKIQTFLANGPARDKVRLVLNRFRKIPGFSDSDTETVTRTKLLWKIPNHYPLVSSSIEKGIPIVQQNHSDFAHSFAGLASALTKTPEPAKNVGQLLFGTRN